MENAKHPPGESKPAHPKRTVVNGEGEEPTRDSARELGHAADEDPDPDDVVAAYLSLAAASFTIGHGERARA